MRYEDGYMLMDETDIKLLSYLKPSKIEETCEARKFMSDMIDAKMAVSEYAQTLAAGNEQRERIKQQVETAQLYVEICDCVIARAERALIEAGVSIQVH